VFFGLFKKKIKSCLGIDFGATGFKIVELAKGRTDRLSLTNYVVAQTKPDSNLNIAKIEADRAAELMLGIFSRAGIKTRDAVVSLSVGETFSTIISIPDMPEDELIKAIPFQAKKYVPIPIEEVVLDWSVVGEFIEQKPPVGATDSAAPAENQEKTESVPGTPKTLQVLIVAVPQEVIRRIAQIAKKTGLKVLAVEQEAFSIVRSLVGKDQGSYLITDLGQENIDLIVMDKGTIRLTYAFEKTAALDLAGEIIKIMTSYQSRYDRKIGKIILTGGGATQANWVSGLSEKLGLPVGVGDPFVKLMANEKLSSSLKEIAPFMAVAVGAAMREI